MKPTEADAHVALRVMALMAVSTAMGCRGAPNQSVLEPSGPVAERLSDMWWFSLTVATMVYLATIGALMWAALRARRRERAGESLPTGSERRMTWGVGMAVGATVLTLLVYYGYDLSVGRVLRLPLSDRPLTIQLIGHQWWWEARYPGNAPQDQVTTANELHVPVGRPVLIEVTSRDVIHSVWIPNLAGKKDLIPGYTDSLWFQADTPGVYRGQCAEFCGHQHAKMALEVVAEPPDDFERWLTRSRQPARPPSDSLEQRGLEIFLAGPCATCHAIQGTPAGSNNGPDLTHFASRRRIAAGTLPNNRGNLAGWIVDPQRVKPGNYMPPNTLSPDDLDALLSYLLSLQ